MRFLCQHCRAVAEGEPGCRIDCPHCGGSAEAPAGILDAGAVIGDFAIESVLGHGGIGVIFLARQISLDRLVALKILQNTFAEDQEYVKGFIREARVAAQISHPNIVQAYAVGEENGIYYFAMEYIEGCTMKQLLKEKGRIEVNQAAAVISAVADALDFAWTERKIVHQDIKPDNIMVTKHGRINLADLGLARLGSGEQHQDDNEDEVLGTPQYISPEQLTGVMTDVRSDIYSLGATFYNFVTGKYPYDGKDGNEIARQHIEGEFVPPKKVFPALPAEIDRIITKMMQKDINDRYQSAAELRSDLQKFLADNGVSFSNTGSVFKMETVAAAGRAGWSLKRKIYTWMCGILLAAVFACGGLYAALYYNILPEKYSAPVMSAMKLERRQNGVIVPGFVTAASDWIKGRYQACAAFFSPSPEKEQTEAPAAGEKTPAAPRSRPEFISAVHYLLVSGLPGDLLLSQADEFYRRFADGAKTAEEQEAWDRLDAIYGRADEELRMEPARKARQKKLQEERAARQAEILKRQREAAEKAEQQRKYREEQRRMAQRIAEEEAALIRRQQAEAKRRQAEFQRAVNREKELLVNAFAEMVQSNDFSKWQDESSEAIKRVNAIFTVNDTERKSKADFSVFVRKLEDELKVCRQYYELFFTSGKIKVISFSLNGTLVKAERIKDHILYATPDYGITFRQADLHDTGVRDEFLRRLERRYKVGNTSFYLGLLCRDYEFCRPEDAPAGVMKQEVAPALSSIHARSGK